MGYRILFIRAIQSRHSWLALMVLGIILEACGLYFQYGLNLPPCINCVYERAIYLYGFILPGLVGFLAGEHRFVRILLCVWCLVMALYGGFIVSDHLSDYYATSGKCALRADFFLIPLDSLLPAMFKPEGGCGPLDWSLLGLSMPIWIGLSYLGLLVAAFVGLIGNLHFRD